MKVVALWRYPVKSLQGEQLLSADVGRLGFEYDRHWGIAELATGVVLSAKREPRLLEAAARFHGDLEIHLPGGRVTGRRDPDLDRVLSGWLGRPVVLREADADTVGHYEIAADFEDDDSEIIPWQGRPGSFRDSRHLHLLSHESLATMAGEMPGSDWSIERFRPNVVLRGDGGAFPEDAWVGRAIALGTARIEVVKRTSRCVMTTRAQPTLDLARDLDVLRSLRRLHGGDLGVLANVVGPGRVAVGDDLEA